MKKIAIFLFFVAIAIAYLSCEYVDPSDPNANVKYGRVKAVYADGKVEYSQIHSW